MIIDKALVSSWKWLNCHEQRTNEGEIVLLMPEK